MLLVESRVFAQRISDPVADFLERHTSAQTGELFEEENWTGMTNTQPTGGYLFRFEAPAGPHGAKITFVASSLNADRRSSHWNAYLQKGDRDYVLVAENFDFESHVDFYTFEHKGPKNSQLAQISSTKKGYVVSAIYLSKAGNLEKDVIYGKDSDFSGEDDGIKAACGLKDEFVPRIEMISLANYLKKPDSSWRLYNSSLGFSSQKADPTEEKVTEDVWFTREEAAALWKTRRLKSPDSKANHRQ